MKINLLRLLALCLWSAAHSFAAEPAPAPDAAFFVANWNVENLYDTVDDPDNDGDDEFLPNNPTTRWSQVRYETKLDNLAQVIAGMNNGNGPDVLGIQEVENEDVLRDLIDRLPATRFGIVHVDVVDRPRLTGVSNYGFLNRAFVGILDLAGVWWLIKRTRLNTQAQEVEG